MTARLSLTAHIQSIKAPWIVLLVLKSGQRADNLIRSPEGFCVKVLKGAKCRTTTGLFREFAHTLHFPDYFGHNWDALEECLADLEWLPAKGYVLLVTEAEEVLRGNEEEYATFLEVVSDAGEAWALGHAGTDSKRATPFHVVLTVSDRDKSKRVHWVAEEISVGPAQQPKSRRASQRGTAR